MFSRPPLRATLIAAIFAAAIVGASGYFELDGARAAGSPVPGAGILRLGSSFSKASGYDRYSYVIVGRGDVAAAASQPGRSLVYHSGTDVNTQWDCGVPYSQALANGWLLKDSGGTLLVNSGYTSNYIGDVGDPAYQAAWASNVASFLSSTGADGVFIDDVLANIGNMTGKRYPAKYPSQAAWEDAMVSFVNYVGPALKQRGFYVLVNAVAYTSGNGASDTGALAASFWQRLGPAVSGLMLENWLQNPNDVTQLRAAGPEWYNNWTGWENLVSVAQAMGRDFVGLTYGSSTNTRAMRYGRASFLLKWNGVGGAFVYDVAGSDPWNTAWTTAIGTPSAAAYGVGAGWRREYTGGTVLVNPSASASQTFSLGGAYLSPDGLAVSSVTLAPTTGIVLSSTAPAPAPTVQKPASLTVPSIGGVPQEAVSLSATAGTWSGSPTSYGYGWQRCDTSGGACTAISGATGATYVLSATDVGTTARVVVTATNAVGSASATSAATAVVAAAPSAPPPASGPSNGNGNAYGKKKGGGRTLAVSKPPLLEWEGRLFSSTSQFHRYLSRRGVAWTPFLDKHPAIVRSLAVPMVAWDGRNFYTQASLKRWLARSSSSYATWAKKHEGPAARLAGRTGASSAHPQPQVLSRSAVVAWDGIGFATASGLKSHLRSQGVAWDSFVAGHPAIARAFGL